MSEPKHYLDALIAERDDLAAKLKVADKILSERCCIDDCGFDVDNEPIEILRMCMKSIDAEARQALAEIRRGIE